MGLVDEELTYALRGCFFDVQNEIGFGLPEEAYQQAMVLALAGRGIQALSKPLLTLVYQDLPVVELRPDVWVPHHVILELKAQREGFAREHYVQLFSYLKASGTRLGFLVNFGRERVEDQRLILDSKPHSVEEDWRAIPKGINDEDRSSLTEVRRALLAVAEQYGLGYGESTYRKLIAAVLQFSGHIFHWEPLATPVFQQKQLGTFPINCMVVDSRIVCVAMALKEGLDRFDEARTSSYIRNLGLRFGVVANFGKEKLQIKGVVAN